MRPTSFYNQLGELLEIHSLLTFGIAEWKLASCFSAKETDHKVPRGITLQSSTLKRWTVWTGASSIANTWMINGFSLRVPVGQQLFQRLQLYVSIFSYLRMIWLGLWVKHLPCCIHSLMFTFYWRSISYTEWHCVFRKLACNPSTLKFLSVYLRFAREYSREKQNADLVLRLWMFDVLQLINIHNFLINC